MSWGSHRSGGARVGGGRPLAWLVAWVAGLTSPAWATPSADAKRTDIGRFTMSPDEAWEAYCQEQRYFGPPRSVRSHRLDNRTFVVCEDLTSDGVMHGPSTANRFDHPIPHSAVLLLVKVPYGTPISVKVTGTRGVHVPGVGDYRVVDESQVTEQSGTSGQIEQAVVEARQKLAPVVGPGGSWPEASGFDLDTVDPSSPDWNGIEAGLQTLRKLESTAPPNPDPQVTASLVALGKVAQALENERAQSRVALYNLDHFVPGELEIAIEDGAVSPIEALVAIEGLHRALRDQRDADRTTDATEHLTALETTLRARMARSAGDVSREWAALVVQRAHQLTDDLRGLSDDEAATEELARIAAAAQQAPFSLDASADPSKNQVTTLTVESTYTGVLRPGAAVGLTTPHPRDYTVAAPSSAGGAAGAAPAGVVEVADGNHLDLVVGYTQYFSRTAQSDTSFRLGVTAGVSAIDFSAGEVDALSMAYTGLEGGWPKFAAALVVTARRSDRLDPWLTVGEPVATGIGSDDIATRTVVFGLGAVVYPVPLLQRVGGAK